MIIDLFSANPQPFQNTQRKHFSWSVHLLAFRYPGLQGCNVREKATASQRFFVIYKILEHYFLSGQFQNVSVVPSLLRSYPVDYISAGKLHYVCFSDNFPMFLTHFTTPSWNHLWRSLVMFWAVDYSPVLNCDYIKNDSNRGNLLKFLVDEIIPAKMSVMNS